MTLLPIFIAGGFGGYFCFGFLKADMAVLNVCRSEQLKTQNKVGKNLASLLKLNPEALRLRTQEEVAKEAVDAALATGYGLAAAEAYLVWVQGQRRALGIRQKLLIQQANLTFRQSAPQLSRDLERKWQNQTRDLSPWLRARFRLLSTKIPTLAVRPDLPDTAPAYERVSGFEEAQSTAQFWQVEVQALTWVSSFLNFKGRFDRSCATSLYSENLGWTAKLKEAKSWSKLW